VVFKKKKSNQLKNPSKNGCGGGWGENIVPSTSLYNKVVVIGGGSRGLNCIKVYIPSPLLTFVGTKVGREGGRGVKHRAVRGKPKGKQRIGPVETKIINPYRVIKLNTNPREK